MNRPRSVFCETTPSPSFFFSAYQAISWAAGPTAEARVREIDLDECLLSSGDHDILVRYAQRGLADLDEAMREG